MMDIQSCQFIYLQTEHTINCTSNSTSYSTALDDSALTVSQETCTHVQIMMKGGPCSFVLCQQLFGEGQKFRALWDHAGVQLYGDNILLVVVVVVHVQ